MTRRGTTEENSGVSEEMLRTMMKQAGLGIVYLDPGGVCLDANDAFCRMTGLSREELVGVRPPYARRLSDSVARSRDASDGNPAREPAVVETSIRRKNGEAFPVRVHPSAAEDSNGKQVGVVAIFEDVSDWRTLHQQLIYAQKMEMADALGGGIAHEFNNLHGGIQGYVELVLGEENLPGQARKDLEIVLRTLHRASRITSQLLAFTRRVPPRKESCSLTQIIDDTVALFAREFESEGIKIEVQSDEEIPELMMDATQIGQVMLNILLNAGDAMRGRDSKRLRLGMGIRESRVVISVSDTGCGIAPENVEHIFKPFFSTKDGTDGRDAGGSGLGLAVSETIVREHGGQIEVSSVPGEGSVFTVWIPAEVSAPSHVPPPVSSQALRRKGSRILVIDDEKVVRSLLERALRRVGHVVESASSGGEALRLLAGNPYELVLVDFLLPDMRGLDVLRAMERTSEDSRPAAIVLSGRTGIEESEELKALGVADILQKPITLESLYASLDRALLQKEALRQDITVS